MTREKRTQTPAERELSPKPPVAINDVLMSVSRTDLTELRELIAR
jgi:hypothetical protein